MNIFSAILFFLASTTAFSGIEISYKNSFKGMDRISIQDHKMAVSQGFFDSKKKVLTVLNPDQKTYFQIDKAYVKDMAERWSPALKAIGNMDEVFALLPEDQQKKLKKMLPKNKEKEDRPELTVKKSGKKETINQIECERVQVFEGPVAKENACVAKASAIGLNSDDHKTLKEFFRFIADISEMAGPIMSSLSSGPKLPLRDFDGLPIQVRDSKGKTISQVSKVSKKTLPSNLFTIPKGFKKVDPVFQN